MNKTEIEPQREPGQYNIDNVAPRPGPAMIVAGVGFLALFGGWGLLYNWFARQWADNDTAIALATAFFWLLVFAVVAAVAWWSKTIFAAWQTRDLLLVAIVAAAFGPLFAAWSAVYTSTGLFLGPWNDLIGGFWWIPVILIPYIVRKPGAALIAEIIAATIETMLGGQYGIIGGAVGGLVQGMGAEVIFMLTGWRRYDWLTLSLAGIASAVTGFVYYMPIYYAGYSIDLLLITLAAYVIGVFIFAVVGGRLLGDALLTTGVLNRFAIGRERRRADAATDF